MEILTPLQRDLLARLGRSPLADEFFLTGGTALAACYLNHRLSDDLDLFTEVPGRVAQVPALLAPIAHDMGAEISFTRTFGTFLEGSITVKGASTALHFAQDAPFRHKPVRKDHPIGFPVDNELDIACNKLSALFDRTAEKDYVDLYFVHHESLPLRDLLPKARMKHEGIDRYWLAQAFQRAEAINCLPRMMKPLDLDLLKRFFAGEAARLMEEINKG